MEYKVKVVAIWIAYLVTGFAFAYDTIHRSIDGTIPIANDPSAPDAVVGLTFLFLTLIWPFIAAAHLFAVIGRLVS